MMLYLGSYSPQPRSDTDNTNVVHSLFVDDCPLLPSTMQALLPLATNVRERYIQYVVDSASLQNPLSMYDYVDNYV